MQFSVFCLLLELVINGMVICDELLILKSVISDFIKTGYCAILHVQGYNVTFFDWIFY